MIYPQHPLFLLPFVTKFALEVTVTSTLVACEMGDSDTISRLFSAWASGENVDFTGKNEGFIMANWVWTIKNDVNFQKRWKDLKTTQPLISLEGIWRTSHGWSDKSTLANWLTVDGGEILHQLIGGKHPIIYRFSTIQGGLEDVWLSIRFCPGHETTLWSGHWKHFWVYQIVPRTCRLTWTYLNFTLPSGYVKIAIENGHL